jgi:hypothetical protein
MSNEPRVEDKLSAFELSRRALWAVGLWLVVSLSASFAVIAFAPTSKVVAPLVLLGLGVVPLAMHRARRRREAEELAKGYTTLPGDHINVDQVHPFTGQLIRAAGEPLLTPAQWSAQLGSKGAGERN